MKAWLGGSPRKKGRRGIRDGEQRSPFQGVLLSWEGYADNVRRVKSVLGDVPGGAVVKNTPANAGDAHSSPGPGRSHMLRSS